MRHIPKFSDDYGPATDDLAAAALLATDLDELDDEDWLLADAEDLDLLKTRRH